jgi:hypothetical protein
MRSGNKWTALAVLVLCLAMVGPGHGARADGAFAYYAGWAVEAYPELTAAEMEAIVRRMVEHGANVVWIGHNNPGEVEPGKAEPGLSYAVYQAYLDPTDPGHEAAAAVVEAQRRMLEACRAVGVRAVLPVGYQIQMGRRWNGEHPDDLRLDAGGKPLDIYGGGVSATFYAASYRRDIEGYYRWVDAEFARPYADVLLMLNLADEPIGGDYSPHAEAEFRRRHGFGFDDVGDDPGRQRLLGEFQSRYVVEYAVYSADVWEEIHPGLPVTMSFDGGQARRTLTLPDVEALFRDTPSNFVVTFDAYPRDGPPNIPLQDASLVRLLLLVRSLGLYSARYDKPVWLWAAANSWGLSQESPDPGMVSDAVANGWYLALLMGQMGGELRGIVYWNYNVKEQGLYNDTHETAYDPETMFAQVSAGLPALRRLMAGGGYPCEGGQTAGLPEPSRGGQGWVLILAPPAVSRQGIGAAREAVRLEVQPYERLAILSKKGIRAAVVASLDGWALDGVRAVVALAPNADQVAAEDVARLGAYLEQGGRVVASPRVGEAVSASVSASAPAEVAYDGLVERRGNLLVAQKGVAVLFEERRQAALSGFWQEVLDLEEVQPGYRIVSGRYVFHYHIDAEPAVVGLELPSLGVGYRYDDQARPVERLRGTDLVVTLGRREYVVLYRVRQAHRRTGR